MNAVVIAILLMFALSLARVSVVFTLVISAVVGGLVAGLGISDTVKAFNEGLGGGAEVALSYAVLGAFALALSKSGLPDLLAHKLLGLLGQEAEHVKTAKLKYVLFSILFVVIIFLSSHLFFALSIIFSDMSIPI